MDITILQENGIRKVGIAGRLDTLTSPEPDRAVKPLIDLGAVIEWFIVRNLNSEVRSVFDMTGFSRILNIE